MFLAIVIRPEVEKSVEMQHDRSDDVPARGVHAGRLEHGDPHRIVAALGVARAWPNLPATASCRPLARRSTRCGGSMLTARPVDSLADRRRQRLRWPGSWT